MGRVRAKKILLRDGDGLFILSELMIVVIIMLMIMKKGNLVLLGQLFSNNLTETKSAVSEYWNHQQKYCRY